MTTTTTALTTATPILRTAARTSAPTPREIERAYLAGDAAAFIDQQCPYAAEGDLAAWWRKGRADRIARDAKRWKGLRRSLQLVTDHAAAPDAPETPALPAPQTPATKE